MGRIGDNEVVPRRDVDHDLEVDYAALVRTSLAAGDTPDRVAQTLIQVHHLLPISAIKALRSGGSMTSDAAKQLVMRHISAEQWAAAEGLWEIVARSETDVNDMS